MRHVFGQLKHRRELAPVHGLLSLLRFLHDIALAYGLFFLCTRIEGLRRLLAELTGQKQAPSQATTTTQEAPGEAPEPILKMGNIWHLAFAPVGLSLAFASGRLVNVYSLLTHTSSIYEGHTGEVTALVWSPDGTRIASASKDGTVQLWEVTTGLSLFTFHRHQSSVRSLAWSPEGHRIASGGGDGTIFIWSALDGSGAVECAAGCPAAMTSLSWSPDGSCLLSGDQVGKVRLWDPVVGTVLDTYSAHDLAVTTVAWCPDASRLLFASAGHDGTVKLWNAETRDCLFLYVGHNGPAREPGDGGVIACAWTPDGKRIISVDPLESIQEWRAPVEGWQALVCITIPLPVHSLCERRLPAHCLAVRPVSQPHGKQATLMAVAGDGWLYIGPSPAEPAAMLEDAVGGRLSPLQPSDFYRKG